jgi:hypothetical protein
LRLNSRRITSRCRSSCWWLGCGFERVMMVDCSSSSCPCHCLTKPLPRPCRHHHLALSRSPATNKMNGNGKWSFCCLIARTILLFFITRTILAEAVSHWEDGWPLKVTFRRLEQYFLANFLAFVQWYLLYTTCAASVFLDANV